MPFTSVLGASSVIKPGVCTSSTRPSAPYVGQLVFETDTNRLVVFTASGWVYQTATGAPGLVHITSGSFTSATSVSLPTNTFSATYRNYRIFLQITSLTADSTLTMRLRASGSDNTTANYRTAGVGITSVANTANVTGNAQTSWNFAEQDAGLNGYVLVCDVFSPQVATFTALTAQYGYFAQTPAGYQSVATSNHFDASTQFDSLSFISSTGSLTGVYRVYGYADS
jgi:hypothetical protein